MRRLVLSIMTVVLCVSARWCIAQDDAPTVYKVTTVTTVGGSGLKPLETVTWLTPGMVRVERLGKVVVIDTAKKEATWLDGDSGVTVTYTFDQLAELRRRYPTPLRLTSAAGEVSVDRTNLTQAVDGRTCRKVVLKHGETTMTAWVDESVEPKPDWDAVGRLLEDDGMAMLRRTLREKVDGVPLRMELKTAVRDIPVTVTERATVEKVAYDKALFHIEKKPAEGQPPSVPEGHGAGDGR